MKKVSDLQTSSMTQLTVLKNRYDYYSLPLMASRLGKIDRLPKSMKVLLENLLRHIDGKTVYEDDLKAVVGWLSSGTATREISFYPTRVLMQDFTGVPAVVDLAAMREAVSHLGGDVTKVNPLSPVDLVIDHSVTVDEFGSKTASGENVRLEMERNRERYLFLKWGQGAFDNFRVVPPGTGICHQVNLEYLGQTVWVEEIEEQGKGKKEKKDNKKVIWPDTLVGTDSHTTMINGLGILGWGVGGIEAEAVMLGQPVSMLIPDVVGFKLTGKLREGITATDLVLTVTQMLRKQGVVGKFVEFYGDGLADLPLADRATIANMAPEYGATCGFFPVDEVTLDYMRLTGRSHEQVLLVEAYTKAQGLWRNPGDEPVFTHSLKLDMSAVEPCLAGPKRPQDRVKLASVPEEFKKAIGLEPGGKKDKAERVLCKVRKKSCDLQHGAVVIAAITSCTNTSNPSVLVAAGLLAKKAVEKGLRSKAWVKTSLAPGSKVVTDYLKRTGLTPHLEKLGFNLVGYGCTTCIGNSGPLPEPVETAVKSGDLTVAAVLSGNRNFEGRIHPLVKTNWLASPPLVVAYALAGNITLDLTKDPLGEDKKGNPVFLKDIWPSNDEITAAVNKVTADMFQKNYKEVFNGDEEWQSIKVKKSPTYGWRQHSTYIRQPPFFSGMKAKPDPVKDIKNARILALLADSVTTDHISPAGNIRPDSPAGKYLSHRGVEIKEFNSYGSRRGNHEVMMRGTFANIRIRNEMVPGVEGGMTRHIPSQNQLSIYDAAMRYQKEAVPLVVIAGKEYGSGSSRDWAAKGTLLLGVRVVIAESFERIHRSNLIGMGILPLEFPKGVTRKTLGLTGDESVSITGLQTLKPGQRLDVVFDYEGGKKEKVSMHCRIDTGNELIYFQHGGILQYVIRKML